MRSIAIVVTAVAFAPLAGCGGDSRAEGGMEPQAVTFVVAADSALFAAGSELEARVWSEEQLEILERNAQCSVTRDAATGAERIGCPEGIVYQEVVPEEFSIPVEAVAAPIELAIRKVRVGERYRLAIAGRSADGCNTTSAQLRGTAGSRRVVLEEMIWETTARACASG